LSQSDEAGSTDAWPGGVRPAHARGEREGSAPPVDQTLRVEIVADLAGIEALTPDYRHLYEVTGNTLPYATQEWHLAWCEHLLSRDPLMCQEPLFCALRSSAGKCVAILPLILTRKRFGPLKVAALALVGADPALTELRDPLVAPGYERATVRTLHELLASMPGWDWIQWNGVSAALAEALALEAAPRWFETLDDYVVDLRRSWPEYLATLSRKMRKNLRHDPLRRDGYDYQLVVARQPAEVRAALVRFLELHTLRANMASGTAHPDRFTTRPLRAFLHGACERLAMRDAVRLFQLRIADQIVASRIGFVLGDSLYLYYSGFEPAWAHYGVMTTMMVEVMRYAIASGLRSVNLSLLAEHSKIRWRPRRVDFYSALVHRDSLRSRLVCRAYHMTMSGQGVPGRLLKHLLQSSRRDWN